MAVVDCMQGCCDWMPSFTTIPGRGVYSHCALEFDADTMFVIGEYFCLESDIVVGVIASIALLQFANGED
jgi:hypothetical protein